MIESRAIEHSRAKAKYRGNSVQLCVRVRSSGARHMLPLSMFPGSRLRAVQRGSAVTVPAVIHLAELLQSSVLHYFHHKGELKEYKVHMRLLLEGRIDLAF